MDILIVQIYYIGVEDGLTKQPCTALDINMLLWERDKFYFTMILINMHALMISAGLLRMNFQMIRS